MLNKNLYGKVLNLASDSNEDFSLGLHIYKPNNRYWLDNDISHENIKEKETCEHNSRPGRLLYHDLL